MSGQPSEPPSKSHAIVLLHGDNFDAHAFLGSVVLHLGARPYIPFRGIEQQLDKGSERRRLGRTKEQPTQSKILDTGDVSLAGTLPCRERRL